MTNPDTTAKPVAYLCAVCHNLIPARSVSTDENGRLVHSAHDISCGIDVPARRLGQVATEAPPPTHGKHLIKMMHDRSPGAVDRIVETIRERVGMIARI